MASDGASSASPPKPASSLTAEDLIRIFNDPQGELQNYTFHSRASRDPNLMPLLESDSGGFRMNLPFAAIKAQVNEIRNDIRGKLDPKAPVPAIEHVGSTSIGGMPGNTAPDLQVIEDQFPPSASTVRAIVAAGFQFISEAPHGQGDYWFRKPLAADDIGKERALTLHLVDKDNPSGQCIIEHRDRCNKYPKEFDKYKNSKLEAREKKSFMEYKATKAQSESIMQIRKDKGLDKHP